MSERKPWHRQPEESPKAFAAFQVYLTLGPDRSIDIAYNKATGKRATAAGGHYIKWSSRFGWVARAKAFDSYEWDQKLEARETAREEARQKLIDEMDELVLGLIKLAKSGTNNDATRLKATLAALSLAGLGEPKIDKASNLGDHSKQTPKAKIVITLPDNGMRVNRD